MTPGDHGQFPHNDAEVARINARWLVRLRWAQVAAQVVAVAVAEQSLGVSQNPWPLAAVFALSVLSNAALSLWLRRGPTVRQAVLGAALAADVLFLTAILHLSGGPSNPFSFLYLVQIALAVVMVGPHQAWLVTALAAGGSALLFVPEPSDPHFEHMKSHLYGMWVAFGITAAFIVYFVSRIRHALSEREAELAEARSRAEKAGRLASLATLAAGAAHELSTPLSTIALVATELERVLTRTHPHSEEATDAALIRQEVARCRDILAHLAVDAGTSVGELPELMRVDQLCATAMEPFHDHVVLTLPAGLPELRLPPRTAAQCLRGLIKNAVQASQPRQTVHVTVTVDPTRCYIAIQDHGHGMTPLQLSRAGEPFFTTKPPGQGMGLGLFLARTVFEQAGGHLRLDSSPATGTRATVELPLG